MLEKDLLKFSDIIPLLSAVVFTGQVETCTCQ